MKEETVLSYVWSSLVRKVVCCYGPFFTLPGTAFCGIAIALPKFCITNLLFAAVAQTVTSCSGVCLESAFHFGSYSDTRCIFHIRC